MHTLRILMVMLITATAAALAGEAVLKVKVTNKETGEPLEGAIVKVLTASYYDVTDKNGLAVIENLPQGSYDIRVSFVGFASVTRSVRLEQGETVTLETAMDADIIPVNDVVVTATRGIERETPVTFSNLTAEEVRRKTASQDLPFALGTLPSVSFHSENGNGLGYTYLRIRGFDQRRISVMINGIPQNDPVEHIIYWINFYDLANSLEDIQVQRGAGAAFYGPPAIGGSINLVTRFPGLQPSLKVESGYGSFHTRKYSVSGSSGLLGDHFILSARATRVMTSGYRDWSWSRFWRFYTNATYFDDDQSLRFTFFGGPQEDGLAFYGMPKSYNDDDELRRSNFSSFTHDREYFHEPQASLQHDYTISENLTLRNTIFYKRGYGFFDFDGTWGAAGYYRLPEGTEIPGDLMQRAFVDNEHYGWLPQIEWKQPFGRLIAGLELRRHRSIKWGRIEAATGLDRQYVGEEADRHFYEYHDGKDVFSVYASQTYRFSDNVILTGDLQAVFQAYRFFDEKYVGREFDLPYTFLNPKLGLNINASDKLGFYFSAALTQREPPLRNLYEAESASWGVEPAFEKNADGSFNYDAPLVEPEELLDFELGAHYNGGFYRFTGTLYWMEFWNEIVPSGGIDVYGQPRVGNAERTRHQGVELEAGVRLLRGLDLSGNLSLSRNRFIEFVEYDGAGNPQSRDGNVIANAPELMANIELSYESSAYRGTLHLQHTGAQYADNTQAPGADEYDVTVDPYTVVNLMLSYTLSLGEPDLVISFDANNLFDEKYFYTALGADNFFPAAERNFFVGLTLEY